MDVRLQKRDMQNKERNLHCLVLTHIESFPDNVVTRNCVQLMNEATKAVIELHTQPTHTLTAVTADARQHNLVHIPVFRFPKNNFAVNFPSTSRICPCFR
jgi:hypothetical protein